MLSFGTFLIKYNDIGYKVLNKRIMSKKESHQLDPEQHSNGERYFANLHD